MRTGDHVTNINVHPVEPKAPSESTTVLAHWMGIADANSSRDIHGGTIMKLVDEAAGIASVRHSRQRTVTASMDRMSFLVPIKIGQLVTFTATVNAAWNTSMEVGVRVEAEDPRTGVVQHASTAYLTFVALDDEGRPTPVPRTGAADRGRGAAHARGRDPPQAPAGRARGDRARAQGHEATTVSARRPRP